MFRLLLRLLFFSLLCFLWLTGSAAAEESVINPGDTISILVWGQDQYTQTISLATGTDVYGTGVYGTAVYAGAGGKISRLDLLSRGRVVRFKFANATAGETFQIDGFGSLAHLETHV